MTRKKPTTTTKKPAATKTATKKPATTRTKKPATARAKTTTTNGAKPRPKVDKIGKVNAALKGIFKNDEHIVTSDPALLKQSLPHRSSGSLVIDYTIGGQLNQHGVKPCPGYPKGKIIQVWGENHSGKTTVCLEAAADVIRNDGQAVYVDWEYAIDPIYASAITGVPVGSSPWFQWTRPNTLEEGFQVILGYAAMGVELIVIDSVGAAILKAMDERSLKEIGEGGTGGAGLGGPARAWNDFLPKLKKVITKSGTTVIAISQTRSKIGAMAFEKKTKAQGGKSWEFYAALRFGLRRVKSHKRKEYNALLNKMEEVVYAGTIAIEIVKCKVAGTTARSGEFYIRHGFGIDNLWTLYDVAKAHGLLKGSSWVTWTRDNGEEFKAQGFKKFYLAMSADPKLQAEFEAAVMPLLNKSPDHVEDDDPEMDLNDLLNEALGDGEDADE